VIRGLSRVARNEPNDVEGRGGSGLESLDVSEVGWSIRKEVVEGKKEERG